MDVKATAAEKKNRWLLECARNEYSQNGEDGIIESVLEVIGERTNWCVEFGAWDGRYLSNVYNLIAAHDYQSVLIEGSDQRFAELQRNVAENANIVPIKAYVGFSEDDGLDSILSRTAVPEEFDVLSIDIDGNDYHVWKAVTRYRPKVVVIEYNPTIATSVDFVQEPNFRVNHGSSIRALARLAEAKGYALVSATQHNCIFVLNEYYDRFGIADNSIDAIRPDESLVTYIFNGFDGTVFIEGHGKVVWHNVPYKLARLQQIPRALRVFPDNLHGFRKLLAKYYRSLRKRRWI